MDYATKVTQTTEELQWLEKQQTNVVNRDYVRFIRLLKERKANSQKQAAQLINLGLRQGQRIWAKYLSEGIDALIEANLILANFPSPKSVTCVSSSMMTRRIRWLMYRLI